MEYVRAAGSSPFSTRMSEATAAGLLPDIGEGEHEAGQGELPQQLTRHAPVRRGAAHHSAAQWAKGERPAQRVDKKLGARLCSET